MKMIGKDLFEKCKNKESVLVSEALDTILPHLEEVDFLLKKNFTIL